MIADIHTIPQTATALLQEEIVPAVRQGTDYASDFFSAWTTSSIITSREHIAAAFSTDKDRYGENFARHPDEWVVALKDNANLEQLGKHLQKGLVVANTNLRKMPTLRPAFYHHSIAGEGYPFDTLQENLLRIGEPVLISHFTKDGVFAFIQTNARSAGFVPVKDLAFVDDASAERYRKQPFGMIIHDNVHLFAGRAHLVTVDIGTYLPLHDAGVISLPVRDAQGMLSSVTAAISPAAIITEPLALTLPNAARIIDTMIGKPYGWGGYLGHRDCAQILKDYFAVFGIHLPIFSAHQIKTGRSLSLAGMDKEEKRALIEKEAKPFRTMLYRKGHVVLYLGQYQGEMVIFHALWGVVTFQGESESRHVVGKSVMTTLEYGKELSGFCEERSNFLQLLSEMTVI